MRKPLLLLIGCLVAVGGANADGQDRIAFPGAEGAGMYATGGRGGDVYYVTTLADSGPGSLRTGISSASGPRTILFDVAGTIRLESDLVINKPGLTIAGQSAPGGGITIADRMTRVTDTHDVILQYMRFRPGDTDSWDPLVPYQPDSLWVANSSDVMIDHVSASWSVDETLSVTHGSTNVTVQWSLITEALHVAGHEKGNHGYGSLINGGDITFHHNLYADNRSRNARPGGSSVAGQTTTLDFVNNVIANPGDRFGYSGGSTEQLQLNLVGNYGVSGPNTTATSLFYGGATTTAIYSSGNLLDRNKNGVLDGGTSGILSGAWTTAATPFELPAVQATDARQAYIQVLSRAGANYYRDPVDRRIVRSVLNQTGDHIDSQTEVGGWPVLPTGPATVDTSRDGLPDWYAIANGLNPAVKNGNVVAANGYTWLENYLHSRSASAASFSPQATGPITVSAAAGRAADATVSENGGLAATSAGSGAGPALDVRWTGQAGTRNEMALVRFDLTGVAPGSIRDARLELTAFRTMEAGQRIQVYGLEHDAAGFDWIESAVRFDSAPGLEFDGMSGTPGLVTDKLLSLGTFTTRGELQGQTIGFDNPNLAVFLNLASSFEGTPSSGLATLLFVREDTGSSQFRVASAEATNLLDGTAPAAAGTYAPRLVLDAARPAPLSLTIASGRHTQAAVGQPTITSQSDVIKMGSGTLILSAANALAGALFVRGGTVEVTSTEGLGGGTVVMESGSRLTLAGGVQASARGLFLEGGLIDLGTGRLTIAAGGVTAAELRAGILAGRAGGTWRGTNGIGSTAAAAAPQGRAVGYTIADDGTAVAAYAAVGDVNLNGQVDVFDLVGINSGGRYNSGQTADWSTGDANYDGVTNVFDLVSINSAGAYNAGRYVGATAGLGGAAAVPEPSGLAAVAVGLAFAVRLRGRR